MKTPTISDTLHTPNGLPVSILKYGYCSYFALAYVEKHPTVKQLFAVMEYDPDLDAHYLVHILFQFNDQLADAHGIYTSWQESIADITDIEFMDLSINPIDQDAIRRLIEIDLGFDDELYNDIRSFVETNY